VPLLVVPKKPGITGKIKYRVWVNFRKLNHVTVGNAFPSKSKYYSTLDLAQGYHQVPVNAADREKMAFFTDKGHYEFLRMQFGLKGDKRTQNIYLLRLHYNIYQGP